MKHSERVTVSVKVLPAYKSALERIAQQEDTSAASVLRRLIRREAVERGLWLVPSAADSSASEAVRP